MSDSTEGTDVTNCEHEDIQFSPLEPDGPGHPKRPYWECADCGEPFLPVKQFRDPVTDPEVEVLPPEKTKYFKSKHEQAIEALVALTVDKEVDASVRFNAAVAILDYSEDEMA